MKLLILISFFLASSMAFSYERYYGGLFRPEPINLTDLHRAAESGDVEKARKLIANGADVNVRDNVGYRPLHFAVINDKVDVAELLVANGADINAPDMFGWTPLHVAAGNGNFPSVKFLVEHGAELDYRTVVDDTALHLAKRSNYPEIAAYLKENGAKNFLTRGQRVLLETFGAVAVFGAVTFTCLAIFS